MPSVRHLGTHDRFRRHVADHRAIALATSGSLGPALMIAPVNDRVVQPEQHGATGACICIALDLPVGAWALQPAIPEHSVASLGWLRALPLAKLSQTRLPRALRDWAALLRDARAVTDAGLAGRVPVGEMLLRACGWAEELGRLGAETLGVHEFERLA